MSILSSEQTQSEENRRNSLTVAARGKVFNDDYKLIVFKLWYKNGKVGAPRLREMMPVDEITGLKPALPTLQSWLADFREQALVLDEQVAIELQSRMIQEKVEMFNRHSETAVKMQNMAMEDRKSVV